MTTPFLLWIACLGAECAQLSNLLPKAEIESRELAELSGVAAAGPGQYWGVNDSGHLPALFRFNEAGEVLEQIKIEHARNIDWEAMARDSAGNLYIADIGDNARRREAYTIYRLSGEGRPSVDGVITFRYEDGVSRNGEAIFAFGGKLYLISKEDFGRKAEVFSLELSAPAADAERRAKRVAVLGIASPVTDVAYSAERKEIAILTYLGAVLYHFEKEEDLLSPPTGQIPGFFGQCEAVAYTSDGQLLITNEPGSLWKIPLPPVGEAPAEKTASPDKQ